MQKAEGRMQKWAHALLISAFCVLPSAFAACTTHSQFLERNVRVEGRVYRYRVWLPPHYTKLRRWPVILFLHGSGERGDDNLRQLGIGLAPALERFGNRYKAVILFPQCR